MPCQGVVLSGRCAGRRSLSNESTSEAPHCFRKLAVGELPCRGLWVMQSSPMAKSPPSFSWPGRVTLLVMDAAHLVRHSLSSKKGKSSRVSARSYRTRVPAKGEATKQDSKSVYGVWRRCSSRKHHLFVCLWGVSPPARSRRKAPRRLPATTSRERTRPAKEYLGE